MKKINTANSAFTIVELLIVIVVIGILAAITLVSYSGITNRATIASIQSDLSNASTLLKMEQITTDNFPTTLALANSGKGITPSQTMDSVIYIPDNTSNPKNFCLQYRKSTTTYAVDNSSVPSSGVCLQNLVTNGDFRNGVSGWSGENKSNFTVENGKGIMYSDGANNALRLVRMYSYVVNRKYYVKINSISTNAVSGTFRFELYDFTYSTKYTHSLSMATTSYSDIFMLSGDLSSTSRFSWIFENFSPLSTTTFYSFDNITVVDLTAIFGADNEPNQTQMDNIMSNYPNSWFNVVAKASL